MNLARDAAEARGRERLKELAEGKVDVLFEHRLVRSSVKPAMQGARITTMTTRTQRRALTLKRR